MSRCTQLNEYYQCPVVLNSMSTPNCCTQPKYLSTPLYSREVLVSVMKD
jgi:hypothetical protein